jgi:hypothetical protein
LFFKIAVESSLQRIYNVTLMLSSPDNNKMFEKSEHREKPILKRRMTLKRCTYSLNS